MTRPERHTRRLARPNPGENLFSGAPMEINGPGAWHVDYPFQSTKRVLLFQTAYDPDASRNSSANTHWVIDGVGVLCGASLGRRAGRGG
jgi:hypothetical protein